MRKWDKSEKGKKYYREYRKKWLGTKVGEKYKENQKQYLKKWLKTEKGRQYLRKNKEYLKKWRRDNKEKWQEYKKEWKKRDPEKKRREDREWNKRHREYRNFMDMIRRMRLKNIEGSFTLKEWRQKKKEFRYTCPICGRKEPEIKLSIDHIIPITKNGTNWILNIQPLCRSCNSRKNNKVVSSAS